MRLRLLSIAFLLGAVGTGLSWLSIQPVLLGLMQTVRKAGPEGAVALSQVGRSLPWLLLTDALLLAAGAYAVLRVSVGKPLEGLQRSLEQLERLDLNLPFTSEGGPLMARFQASLRRAAEALSAQQQLSRSQLESLKAAQTELVASERLATVGKLAAGVAHEVGNPLSGMLGYLSLARQKVDASSEVRSYLDLMETEVHRIDGIVRGLLELGRPKELHLGPVELKGLADTCVQLVRGGPDFKQVSVAVDVLPGLIVRADSSPLSQVFINLLINAAQAMGGVGRVTLRGHQEENRTLIEVEDTGPGIPSEVLPHVFEPFFTTKAAGKGTGLGLSVCDHLIRAMGGQLRAENRETGGARFTVTLASGEAA